MHSVRNPPLVAEKKRRRPATESIETQDARFAESTLRLFVDAFRAGRELPNRDTVHKHFYDDERPTFPRIRCRLSGCDNSRAGPFMSYSDCRAPAEHRRGTARCPRPARASASPSSIKRAM